VYFSKHFSLLKLNPQTYNNFSHTGNKFGMTENGLK
jgi:hypothetical protein